MNSGYHSEMAARPKSKQVGPVSTAVASLRAAAEMTQQEFAQLLGVAVPTVGRWETGRVPDKKFLQELILMAIRLERDDLREVFEFAHLQDAGVQALVNLPKIARHLAFAQSELSKLTSHLKKFRKQALSEDETMEVADKVWASVCDAKSLVDALGLYGNPYGPRVQYPEPIDTEGDEPKAD